MLKIDPVKAGEYFHSGYNCAEAMALAASEAMGISSDLIPRMASALGGGMSYRGDICGIVSGGLLVIGMLYGRRNQEDDNFRTYFLGYRFQEKFLKEAKSLKCFDLTGLDFMTEEAHEKFYAETQNKTCIPLLEKAVEIINKLIETDIQVDGSPAGR